MCPALSHFFLLYGTFASHISYNDTTCIVGLVYSVDEEHTVNVCLWAHGKHVFDGRKCQLLTDGRRTSSKTRRYARIGLYRQAASGLGQIAFPWPNGG